ncbi:MULTISPECIES: hypothetical protein [Anaeromyxobacter]|uniref:hypothetical protein n=1 Tax=Anaeromyxobacter TaxID=161492 RepID=UPI001F5A1BEA|nr:MULTISPECIES: hypothetical protein [unclassified Anaeromyxobacter]
MNLLENPFHLLGATTRDDRRRVLELAEERALSGDPGVCSKARADLTNPRNRVAAEIAWLPGTPADKVRELLRALEAGSSGPARESARRGELTPLGAANFIASMLGRCKTSLSVDEAVERIRALALADERADRGHIRALLNEDRAAAGFPPITDDALLDHALSERREYYRAAIRTALDRMTSRDIVAVVTRVVEQSSQKGRSHAPLLVDNLVDTFEGEAKAFLEREAENLERLFEAIRKAAEAGASRENVTKLLRGVKRVLRNWDSVAQPIQLSAMSRGMDHALSFDVATSVRNVALQLNNEHGMRWAAEELTKLVRDVFAEVPRIVELISKDMEALERLARAAKA